MLGTDELVTDGLLLSTSIPRKNGRSRRYDIVKLKNDSLMLRTTYLITSDTERDRLVDCYSLYRRVLSYYNYPSDSDLDACTFFKEDRYLHDTIRNRSDPKL